ncbi:MAG: ABC transporter permease [Anaerolineae bacterium]|jgi:putative ABC transport system permease protein|nr:ABC transporter permease [Anaerolineae bacterium]
MNLTKHFKIALRALTANKMRSILTMLGIIIGVGAVVALLSIGTGATASITSQIEGIGSNLITVIPGELQTSPGGQLGASVTSDLYYEDYEAIERQVVRVNGIAPTFQSSYTVKYNNTSTNANVTGVTDEFFDVLAFNVETGRTITESDNRSQKRVAILGATTAEDLFGKLSPVGKSIKINGVRFEVIGKLEYKGGTTQNTDDVILIPLETGYVKLFGENATQDGRKLVQSISLSTITGDDVENVMAQTDRILRREHRLEFSDDADFTIVSQSDFLSALDSVSTILQVFLGAIAGISLLVGGIGIMNIMLVSVTERTKEIGLRKAVGARKKQILIQFLVETVTLSVLGGLLGIFFGVGIAWGVTVLDLIAAEITISSMVLAFFFAVVVGVFFGIYPAFRAANLHPIEALRYE